MYDHNVYISLIIICTASYRYRLGIYRTVDSYYVKRRYYTEFFVISNSIEISFNLTYHYSKTRYLEFFSVPFEFRHNHGPRFTVTSL